MNAPVGLTSHFVGLVIIECDGEIAVVNVTRPAITDLKNLKNEPVLTGIAREGVGFFMSIIVGIFVSSLKELNEGIDTNDIHYLK